MVIATDIDGARALWGFEAGEVSAEGVPEFHLSLLSEIVAVLWALSWITGTDDLLPPDVSFHCDNSEVLRIAQGGAFSGKADFLAAERSVLDSYAKCVRYWFRKVS